MLFLADLMQVREVIKDSKVHLYKLQCNRGREVAKMRCLFMVMEDVMEPDITDTRDRLG